MEFMKNILLILLVTSCISFLSGCTSITYTDTTNTPQIDKQSQSAYKEILITNYGYYLFNTLPLGSGGLTDGSFSLFKDNVNLDKAMQALKDECKKNEINNFSNIQVSQKSTCTFGWVPYLGTTLGLYWFKEIQISAVLYSDKFKNEKEAQ